MPSASQNRKNPLVINQSTQAPGQLSKFNKQILPVHVIRGYLIELEDQIKWKLCWKTLIEYSQHGGEIDQALAACKN